MLNIPLRLQGHPETRQARRRAYTVLESVVVLGLIALVGSAAFVMLGSGSSAGEAAAARASLLQVLKLQTVAGDAPTADIATLTALDPGRQYTVENSTGTDVVSLTVEGTSQLAAAVYDGADCWMLLRDFASTTAAGREIWVVEQGNSDCNATRALEVATPDETSDVGRSAKRPRLI